MKDINKHKLQHPSPADIDAAAEARPQWRHLTHHRKRQRTVFRNIDFESGDSNRLNRTDVHRKPNQSNAENGYRQAQRHKASEPKTKKIPVSKIYSCLLFKLKIACRRSFVKEDQSCRVVHHGCRLTKVVFNFDHQRSGDVLDWECINPKFHQGEGDWI